MIWGRGQLGVDQESHDSGAAEDGMVRLAGCELQGGDEVAGGPVGVIFEDGLVGLPRGPEFEDVADSHPEPPEAGPASAATRRLKRCGS